MKEERVGRAVGRSAVLGKSWPGHWKVTELQFLSVEFHAGQE
jgi:hypothetical protein